MMKKNKIRIFTSLLTVVFCFTIFSTIAFAIASAISGLTLVVAALSK